MAIAFVLTHFKKVYFTVYNAMMVGNQPFYLDICVCGEVQTFFFAGLDLVK